MLHQHNLVFSHLTLFRARLCTSLVLFLMLMQPALSQRSFKADFKKANPVDVTKDISVDSSLAVHKAYLNKAIKSKDTLSQLYAYFFLYVDYYKKVDYPKVEECFLKASNLVSEHSNPSWKAAISMRKAHLVELIDDDVLTAIKEYEKAIKYCTIAKDSICIAECLEQLSNLNGQIENYDLAQGYLANSYFDV